MLRCTIFDKEGAAKSSSGVFKKSKLCSEHGLEPRDLRKIDSRVPNLVPTILARKSGILVNILHIRAMIKADMVLLFDSYGSSDTQLHSAFIYNLQFNLRQGSSSLPYEFRALESILVSVLDALRIELDLIRTWTDRILEGLDEDVDREKLRALLQVSRKLNSFLSRSRGVKVAVTEVLEADEDMALMYLTDAMKGSPRTELSNHDELELLLESFDKQVEEVVAETEQINGDLTNTQEVVELILDSNRNKLLALDLKTSIATLGLSAGTLWAGLFGMNLRSHFEDHEYAFFASSSIAFVVAFAVAIFGFRQLERLRTPFFYGTWQGSQLRSNSLPFPN
ncbi:Mg2+ transporter protein cora-like protein [Violaceomyces palustris]|uniref:Mg2+ transporter protein cora-like protein n=1 Tax=Violaceomyces palustris TaxID=1673888 RepID=A0ACD0NXQ6_9BASI|nr:Mg2+ transporter protein cora-like protein [Violaceomyces palustris]